MSEAQHRYSKRGSSILAALVLPALVFLNACDNSAPQAPNTAALSGALDTYSVAAGMTLRREAPGVLTNDKVSSSSITARLVSGPRYGELEFQEDGAFTYTPTYKFTGHDTFRYVVVDGEELSEPVTVHIGYPNVVFILVDDLGLGDLGIYGEGSVAETPNIDTLAAAGIAFSSAHAPAAVCSPSRYSVLTGNYPYRGRISSGVWNIYDPSTMIIPGQTTLGTLFNEAGFRTAFIGKTHNGSAFWNNAGNGYTANHSEIDFTRPFDRGPRQFGFDYSFLLPGGVSSLLYAYFENDRLVRYDPATGDYQPFADNRQAHDSFVRISQGWKTVHNGGYIGAPGWVMDNYDSRKAGSILTRKAISFMRESIEANRNKVPEPFFLYFGATQLHTPYSPAEFFNVEDTRDDQPATEGARVAGASDFSARTDMIIEIDLMVGAITEFLEKRGQLENTLIVISSDNGPVWGKPEANLTPSGTVDGIPLRGLKGDIFEGGHRVPLLARWGAGPAGWTAIDPGATSRSLLGLQDLAATFYSLLGRQRPAGQANDSKSFLPLLLGDRVTQYPPRDHLIVQGSPQSADPDKGAVIDRAFYKEDAAGDLWKLTITSSNTDPLAGLTWNALYNLSTDPGETRDLLQQAEQDSLVRTMKADYLQLISQPRTIMSFQ